MLFLLRASWLLTRQVNKKIIELNWIELNWIIIGNAALVLPTAACKVLFLFHSANFQAVRRNKMLDPMVFGTVGRANISSPCSCPKFYHIAGEYRPSFRGVGSLIHWYRNGDGVESSAFCKIRRPEHPWMKVYMNYTMSGLVDYPVPKNWCYMNTHTHFKKSAAVVGQHYAERRISCNKLLPDHSRRWSGDIPCNGHGWTKNWFSITRLLKRIPLWLAVTDTVSYVLKTRTYFYHTLFTL